MQSWILGGAAFDRCGLPTHRRGGHRGLGPQSGLISRRIRCGHYKRIGQAAAPMSAPGVASGWAVS